MVILARIYDFIEKDDYCYDYVHARRDFPAHETRLMWRTTLADTVAPYWAA